MHVHYHNDLHAADVAQMAFMFIEYAKLDKLVELTYLEGASLIIAAMCHDVEHDGFNNSYHVNAGTERSMRYHDQAVQENWHAAVAVRLMQ